MEKKIHQKATVHVWNRAVWAAIINVDWQKTMKTKSEKDRNKDTDQLQRTPFKQKWCAASSRIFSRNCTINKLSHSIPTALHVHVIFYLFMCFNLCVLNPLVFWFLVWISVSMMCVYLWCDWCVFDTMTCLFTHVWLFSSFWVSYSEAMCI